MNFVKKSHVFVLALRETWRDLFSICLFLTFILFLVKGAELRVAVHICNIQLKISATVSVFPPSYFYMALLSAMSLLIHYGMTLDLVHLILQSGTKYTMLKYTYMGRKVKGHKIYLVLDLRKQFFGLCFLTCKINL